MGEEGTKNLANEQSHVTMLSGPLGPIEIERGDPSAQPFGVSLMILEGDDTEDEKKNKVSTKSLHFSLYAPNAEKVQLASISIETRVRTTR